MSGSWRAPARRPACGCRAGTRCTSRAAAARPRRPGGSARPPPGCRCPSVRRLLEPCSFPSSGPSDRCPRATRPRGRLEHRLTVGVLGGPGARAAPLAPSERPVEDGGAAFVDVGGAGVGVRTLVGLGVVVRVLVGLRLGLLVVLGLRLLVLLSLGLVLEVFVSLALGPLVVLALRAFVPFVLGLVLFLGLGFGLLVLLSLGFLLLGLGFGLLLFLVLLLVDRLVLFALQPFADDVAVLVRRTARRHDCRPSGHGAQAGQALPPVLCRLLIATVLQGGRQRRQDHPAYVDGQLLLLPPSRQPHRMPS